jgi:phospholipid/cholesterol/gamma-HCH transport system permease protein
MTTQGASGGGLPTAPGRAATPLRRIAGIGAPLVGVISHVSGVAYLTWLTLYFCTVGVFRGQTRMRKQLFGLMSNVGVKSVPIVALVSFLIGAILVVQTGQVMKTYGAIDKVPGLVALSITRSLGPLMTAIVLTARVGGSFTAVLASMRINDEIMALETMAIHPVGYLVAPRFIAMIVMVPCLTVFSYLVGMVGGWLVASGMYDISTTKYIAGTMEYLRLFELTRGLVKSVIFATLITQISCYFGFITEGGPMGLGRSTMVSVVTTLVLIILAEALADVFIVAHLAS